MLLLLEGFLVLGMFHETAGGEIQLRKRPALQPPPSHRACLGSSQGHPRAMNLKRAPSRLIWPALKCPPITNVGVSAKRENSSRRVTADALGSESAVDDQSRCAIWQG